jgi:hypothetical protein
MSNFLCVITYCFSLITSPFVMYRQNFVLYHLYVQSHKECELAIIAFMFLSNISKYRITYSCISVNNCKCYYFQNVFIEDRNR